MKCNQNFTNINLSKYNKIHINFSYEAEPKRDRIEERCNAIRGRGRSRNRWKHNYRINRSVRHHYPEHNCCNTHRASARIDHRRCFSICTFASWSCVQDMSNYLIYLWSLPCLLTEILSNNVITQQYAPIPLLLTFFPMFIYLIDNVRDNSIADILVLGNVIFLSAYSSKFGYQHGLVTAIEFCVTYFILKVHRCEDCPKDMCCNFGIIFFCILSYLTVSGSNIPHDSGMFCFLNFLNPCIEKAEGDNSACTRGKMPIDSEKFCDPSPLNIILDNRLVDRPW